MNEGAVVATFSTLGRLTQYYLITLLARLLYRLISKKKKSPFVYSAGVIIVLYYVNTSFGAYIKYDAPAAILAMAIYFFRDRQKGKDNPSSGTSVSSTSE